MENKNPKDADYDRGITSAETAARMEREGDDFKKPSNDPKGFDTTAGTTVDREGLANNYAVEPEMYIEEPGDLREKQEAEEAQRAEELKEVNESGGKGVGLI